MDLRGIANGVTSTINPNETVIVRRSTGYTIGAGAKQSPTYAKDVSGPAQVQALDGSEIKQIESLNIQGVIRGIYLKGNLAGVVRPKQTGGDLVLRNNGTEFWLVVKVLETWPQWTKAVIVLQNPPA